MQLHEMAAGQNPQQGAMFGGGTGFTFKKRYERVDWRKIAAADVEKIARELDFVTLQENIANITFCTIENEVGAVDPNFLKLFKMAQLTIEYLLHSQDYLSSMITGLEERVSSTTRELEGKSTELLNSKEELKRVKVESHKRKKLLIAQQVMMDRGPESFHACPYCTKGFINQSFLTNHVQKRHKHNLSEYLLAQRHSNAPAQPATQTAQTPAHVQAQPVGVGNVIDPVVQQQVMELQQKLVETQQLLEQERNAANAVRNKKESPRSPRRKRDVDESELERQHKEELEKMHKMYLKDLKEMEEKQAASQMALERAAKARSNLGELRDEDDEEEMRSLRKQIDRLKNELQEQKESAETALRFRQKKEDKKWEKKMAEIAASYEQKLQQVIDSRDQETDEVAEQLEPRASPRRSDARLPQMAPIPSESSLATEKRHHDDSDHDEVDRELARSACSTMTQSLRLKEKLQQHPEILAQFREDMKTKLHEDLVTRGLEPGVRGLAAPQLERYMNNITAERRSKAKKYDNSTPFCNHYGNFRELQRSLSEQVDQKARTRLGKAVPRLTDEYDTTMASSATNMGAVIYAKKPRPAPRSPRRDQNGTLSSLATTNQGTMRSLDSQGLQDSGSEDETDDDEDDSESYTDDDEYTETDYTTPRPKPTRAEADRALRGLGQQRRDPPPPASGPPAPSGPTAAQRVARTSGRAPAPVPQQSPEESDDNWDTDEISEMDQMAPKASSTPEAKKIESVVSQTAKSIELQLAGRSAKKPAGGVDLAANQRSSVRSSDQSAANGDDELCSVSELSEIDKPAMGVKRSSGPAQPAARSSVQSVQSITSWDDEDSDLEI